MIGTSGWVWWNTPTTTQSIAHRGTRHSICAMGETSVESSATPESGGVEECSCRCISETVGGGRDSSYRATEEGSRTTEEVHR